MLDAVSLRALRMISTDVSGHVGQVTIQSDHDIIAHTERFFLRLNFISLASRLLNVARINNFRWDDASWIFADGTGDGVVLEITHKSKTQGGILLLVRSFRYDYYNLVAYHKHLVIPKSLQCNGISSSINKAMFAAYIQLGVKTIKVNAGSTAGGYVWARVGFSAISKVEVDEILFDAEYKIQQGQTRIMNYDLIEQLREEVEKHYRESNENFPIWRWGNNRRYGKDLLLGSQWQGELHLVDSRSFTIFKDYINK